MRILNNKLLVIVCMFISLNINSQIRNTKTKPSLTKYSLAEKIYLQLDNTIYQTGDKVWFKAIVSKSYDNSLSDISEILHVELIDSTKTTIDSKLLKLKSGIANGSFDLQKGFKSGKYLIRAYTKWNRNFDEDFIFSQIIDVINLNEKVEPKKPILNIEVSTGDFKTLTADINPKVLDQKFNGKLKLYIDTGSVLDSIELNKNENNIYKLDYKLPKNASQAELKFKFNANNNIFRQETDNTFSKTVIIDKDYLNLQFFPEGGKLVNGILSTVAFKAIDYSGLGKKVEGQIIDNTGNDVTTFNSNDLGMGTFKLLPQKGKSYSANITIKDIVYKYNLPIAKIKGSVLSLVNLRDEIKLLVASNSKICDNFSIQTQAKGVKYHNLSFGYKDTINVSIPRLSLPDGIIKFSILNDNKQIVCERLFFNNREDYRLDIKLASDKASYRQRDKVSLKLKLDSLQALDKTSLSVLVVDKERADLSKAFKSHILSYLLLNSELKGFVENPYCYFDKKNYNRLLDIDALMLTQGWRAYKYEKTAPNINYRHQAEKKLVVSGTVGEYFNPKKRPKKPLDINLFVYGEPLNTYNQEITPKGTYFFELDDVYMSNAELFMQVVDKKGKPIDFNINIDKSWSPKVRIQKEQSVVLPRLIKSNFIEQIEIGNIIQKEYETSSNTIALDEVKLKDYKLTPARKKSIERNGEPSAVIEGEELRKKAPKREYGIYSVLEVMYPNLVRIKRVGRYGQAMIATVVGSDVTLVLLDGKPVHFGDYQYLARFPINDVESIDIIKKAKEPSQYLADVSDRPVIINGTKGDLAPKVISYINIYTFSKNGLYKNIKSKGILMNTIEGFSEEIEFYTPNYETLSNQDWVIPDNRSVIHWSPNIALDAKGEFTIEFYNDDHIGEVSVIVEAISKDGKIGYVEKTYTIKEAER